MNALDLYLKVSRLIFGSAEIPFSQTLECLKELSQSLKCNFCQNLLKNPCYDDIKKHFVCGECLGNQKPQYHLEKNTQIKLLLNCYKDLCEYIKTSWLDANQKEKHENVVAPEANRDQELLNIVNPTVNYLSVPEEPEPVINDEYSPTSEEPEEEEESIIDQIPVPIAAPLPEITPLPPPEVQSVDPTPIKAQLKVPEIDQTPLGISQNPNIITLIPPPQIIQQPISMAPSIISSSIPQQIPVPAGPTIVQYPPHSQQQKKITITPNTFNSSLTGKPLSTYLETKATKNATVAPIKITLPTPRVSSSPSSDNSPFSTASPSRTIYSVMYTGSGNKITLKRRTTSDGIDQAQTQAMSSVGKEPKIMSPAHLNNVASVKKLENTKNTSEFKKPIQIFPSSNPSPTTNNINQFQSKTMKRRGCRCGNATATPGKLTCCGQRCPCYVDSKACIDCKCRGCRNPHFVDGLKKMRHHVPDLLQQQQQQQSYFASFQQPQPATATTATEMQPQTSQQTDFGTIIESGNNNNSLLNPTTKNMFSNNSSSTNSCIINVSNNNGHYHIKSTTQSPQSPQHKQTPTSILYPTTSIQAAKNLPKILPKIPTTAGIQIVGVYTPQMSMVSGNNIQKIIMKSEGQTISLADLSTTATMTTTTSAGKFHINSVNNFQPNSLMMTSKSIPQQAFYLDENKKFIMIKQDSFGETTSEGMDQKDVIIEEM